MLGIGDRPAFECCAHPKAGRNIFFSHFSTLFVHFKPFSVISRLKSNVSTSIWVRAASKRIKRRYRGSGSGLNVKGSWDIVPKIEQQIENFPSKDGAEWTCVPAAAHVKLYYYLYVSKSDLVRGVGVYLRVRDVVTSCLLITVISEVIRGMVRMLNGTVLLLENKVKNN